MKKGNLSINSDNIFPIIKKWMYSDQDIFVREQISNACDAVTKLMKLSLIGEWDKPSDYKGRVDVTVDTDKRTISFSDNGIGMTSDEVEKYITDIAFSGAKDFLDKYKDKANSDQIIGHFGLGFYSAFMVSDLVTIDTLSYIKDSKPVHWECSGGIEYEMSDGSRTSHGTTITLHLTDDSLKYANEWGLREIIEKYCSFMPVEIYLSKFPKDSQTIDLSEKLSDDIVLEEIPEVVDPEDEKKNTPARLKIQKRPVLINETHPLWGKNPSECSKDDYLKFYTHVFKDYREPLFWIHLNMDYPYNLKGILYFPKINTEYDSIEGTIKLYNNQVFIADNIREVIPEYLMLLKGVIDCPDLPLNVSRSQLQNDGFVKKISDYITKKVADKLSGLCKTDRENYEKYWGDISPFIKYGCLRDDKFCEKMTDYILFKDLSGKFSALPECLGTGFTDTENKESSEANDLSKNTDSSVNADSSVNKEANEISDSSDNSLKSDSVNNSDSSEEQKTEDEKTIYYVSDPVQQSQYIRIFKNSGRKAYLLPDRIDVPFIEQLERKNTNIHFKRIDAFSEEFNIETDDSEKTLFKELEGKLEKLFRENTGKDKLNVKISKLSEDISSMLTVSEESRRMSEMMKMYSEGGMKDFQMPVEETLILNYSDPLVRYLSDNENDPEKKETLKLISEELYDLSAIQQSPLNEENMAKFIERTNELLRKLI